MRILLCLFLGSSLALSAQATGAFDVPLTRKIGPPEGHTPASTWVTPVEFTHGKHTYRVGCTHCHHMQTDDSVGAFLPCRECHVDSDIAEPSGFYRAWHGAPDRSCLGCHGKTRREGKGNPPYNCTGDCHPGPDGPVKKSS